MDDRYSEGARVFKALGDSRRAMIVDMLSCGELCACRILERLEMSQPTLSHHMKLLCECGIVRCREEGKWTYYSLDRDTIERAKAFLNEITEGSAECVCKISENGE